MDAPLPTEPAARFNLLQKEYRAQLGAKAPLPPLTTALTTAKKVKGETPDYAPASAELTAALLERIKVSDTELADLGVAAAHMPCRTCCCMARISIPRAYS